MKLYRLLFVIGLVFSLLVINTLQVNADTPGKQPAPWPPPITDPSKATPMDPLKNTLNPESPDYHPEGKYGTPGTRFGPPGQNSESLLIANGFLEVGHRNFGTRISTYSNVNFAYAQHTFFSDLSIPSGTDLYAPTLLCPNYSAFEIVTRYRLFNGTMRRTIAVFDHYSHTFLTEVTDVSNYLSGGYYTAEILKYGSYWYAMLYNYSTSSWDTICSQSVSQSGTHSTGWDWWEEWSFNESSWPDLASKRFETQNLQIGISGTAYYVTSSYGNEEKDMGSAPYTCGWVNNYYRWYVQD